MNIKTNSNFVHPFIANKESYECQFQFSVELMEWLMENYHPCNRVLIDERADCVTRDALAGKWYHLSGNTIRFDVKGNVIDGQHRMRGHIAARKPMISSVIYGLPVDAIDHIDNGRPRTTADNSLMVVCRKENRLSTEVEVKAVRKLYQIAKWYTYGVRWMMGEDNAKRRISDAELRAVVQSARIQLQFAQEAAKNRHTSRPGFLSALAIYYTKHPTKALKFRDQMVHGVHAAEAVVALRDYLLQGSDGGTGPVYDHFNTVHAINCFHNNRPVASKFPFTVRTSWAV